MAASVFVTFRLLMKPEVLPWWVMFSFASMFLPVVLIFTLWTDDCNGGSHRTAGHLSLAQGGNRHWPPR